MIQDITISRNKVYGNAIQCSDNQIISINQGYSLLVLEPKFPNMHQSVEALDCDNNNLITKSLYNHLNILDGNTTDKFDIRKFNKVTITSQLTDFDFTRVEPIIVKHQWSKTSITNKNCSLFVMFNSGEVIKVERFHNEWLMQCNFFDIIARDLAIDVDNKLSEFQIDYSQYLKLKIKNFEVVDDSVFVLTECNEIRKYSVDLTLQEIFEINDNVILFRSTNDFIIYTTTNNEVIILKDSISTTILNPSRFKITNLSCSDNKVYITNLKELIIYDIESDSSNSTPIPQNAINSIVRYENKIILSDNKNLICTDSIIQNILDKHLRLMNIKNDGKFIIYGITLTSGVLSIVYKPIVSNILNYTILSKQEYKISFISIDPTIKFSPSNHNLGLINSIWFQNYNNFKVFTDNALITNELIEKFLNTLKLLKTELSLESSNSIPLSPHKTDSFKQYLIENFTNHQTVTRYQDIYNFNETYIMALNALVTKLKSISKIDEAYIAKAQQYHDELSSQQLSLVKFIKEYLIKLVLEFNYPIDNDVDKFVVANYHLFIGSANPYPDLILDIHTDYVTESFKVGDYASTTPQLKSQSNHYWTMCDLTFLPLLDLNTNTDLLDKFNYSTPTIDHGLAYELSLTLNYCIITGNRFK